MSGSSVPNVSRETSLLLRIFEDLLRKWNRRINLVSASSLDALHTRHIADSAQLCGLAAHPVELWADLGSGGGFPGLVVAILATETGSPVRTTLIESDARKAAFLREAVRATGVAAEVVVGRIEALAPLNADVLSARALAGLPELLGFAERHLRSGGTAIFPKGASWRDEIAEAEKSWKFSFHADRSETDSQAVVLSISGVSRV